MKISTPFFASLAAFLASTLFAQPEEEWISLFDGKTLSGWQANENPQSWQIEDSALVTSGPRSHLFYVGPVADHDFKNFELSVDVMTEPGANSGIYAHTKFQPEGWPADGYECQVINSTFPPSQPDEYVERKLTGSIYAIRNTYKAPVEDGEWFNYRIRAQGRTLQTFVDGVLICEYTEPSDPYRPEDKARRLLSSGTFAIQAHDPGSVVRYRNIKVRLLPDDLPTPGKPLADAELAKLIVQLSNDNYELIDFGVSAPSGEATKALLSQARRYGLTLGVQHGDAHAQRQLPAQLAFHGWRFGEKPWQGGAARLEGEFDFHVSHYSLANDSGSIDSFGGHLDLFGIDLVEVEMADGLSGEARERYEELLKLLAKRGVALLVNDGSAPASVERLREAKAAGVKIAFSSGGATSIDPARLKSRLEGIRSAGLAWHDLWAPHGR